MVFALRVYSLRFRARGDFMEICLGFSAINWDIRNIMKHHMKIGLLQGFSGMFMSVLKNLIVTGCLSDVTNKDYYW